MRLYMSPLCQAIGHHIECRVEIREGAEANFVDCVDWRLKGIGHISGPRSPGRCFSGALIESVAVVVLRVLRRTEYQCRSAFPSIWKGRAHWSPSAASSQVACSGLQIVPGAHGQAPPQPSSPHDVPSQTGEQQVLQYVSPSAQGQIPPQPSSPQKPPCSRLAFKVQPNCEATANARPRTIHDYIVRDSFLEQDGEVLL